MQAEAWFLEVDTVPSADALDTTALDAHERQRAASFVRASDRTLYTVAHLALRTLLARLLGARPEELAFAREPCPCCGAAHGRPVLAVPEPPVHFSLSHTQGLVLVATAPVPVGADAQLRPAPGDVTGLLPALHPAERAALATEPDPARRAAAFGRIWARKEAYLKGLGTGLGRDSTLDDLAADPAGWTVDDLPCGPRHHAAVALRAARPDTRPPVSHHVLSLTEL
ncbi:MULTISPECIES: 4'-phosphopantetheinyl transferase superfamily protein [unclassified Streptomyces]|uniref:4'-phosphopantetheinyl transferase family protein n=1 Tax=unclassified Streptomyces TaxID=2593676 RepID=UPI002E31E66E|nr:4'-phosphopantetheinyl transferase superfamily protein [Streptomyces sp. NBC_01268]